MSQVVDTLVRAAPGAVRVSGKLGGKHPADGMTAQVNIGDGAVMTIQNPWSFVDGGVGWHLANGNAEGVKLAAASLIESYDYLLSDAITMKEATRRLRVLRDARRALAAEGHAK